MTSLQSYRHLMKKMKFYPSVNRLGILQAIKEEFRENRVMSDAAKINA